METICSGSVPTLGDYGGCDYDHSSYHDSRAPSTWSSWEHKAFCRRPCLVSPAEVRYAGYTLFAPWYYY